MPELRKDPVVDRWVFVASERAKRPTDFSVPHEARRGGKCPFCPGNEALTPPEVAALRAGGGSPDSGGWTVRVVPNKFPAVSGETGAHEVIVETTDHAADAADYSEETWRAVVGMWRRRLRAQREGGRAYRLLFKNQGAAAGASLEHSHSQLIALPSAPARAREEITAARGHRERTGRCAWCDALAEELRDGRRIVEEADGFVVLAPYASRAPFELAIVPRTHAAALEDTPEAIDAPFGRALRAALWRLRGAVSDPPFNLMLHSAPTDTSEYHWRVEVVPTLAKLAGFEWGSGCYINPTPPEDAARYLRSVEP